MPSKNPSQGGAPSGKAEDIVVFAHIRHEHTPYDRLLMRHGDRQLARQEVSAKIDEVLGRWQLPAT